jgi:hypothetical protein
VGRFVAGRNFQLSLPTLILYLMDLRRIPIPFRIVLWAMCMLILLAHGVAAQSGHVLQSLIFREMNAVRDTMKLPGFERDAALDKAAQMQAEWCSRMDSLMHDQPGHARTHSLFNRVALGHGTHSGLEENVFFIHPNPKLTVGEWARQAVDGSLFTLFYATHVLNPNHRFVGIGVHFDKKTQRLAVCQVFAATRWQPPVGARINRHAFGIRPANDKCCKPLDKQRGLEVDFIYGWDYKTPDELEESGRRPKRSKLEFFHRVYPMPAKILQKPRGKAAPDFVFRDQFPCNEPNQLHGSPYHDGYLKRPRGWGFMAFWHNRPVKKDDKALSVNTHRAPVFNEDSMQVNTVITKKHRFCRCYEFLPDTIPFGVRQQWRRKQLSFRVPFQKGLAVPDSLSLVPLLDSLRLPGAELLNVRIRGLASVEGTLDINQDLFNRRAKSILDRIQKSQVKPVRMSSSAAENWPDFRRDLRGTAWAPLLRLSNDQVRDTLTRDKALLAALEPILARHRYASVEIDLRFALDNTVTNEKLIDSLHGALNAKQYPAAHALQSEMWRRWEVNSFPADTFLSIYFPRVEGCLPMVHNQYCMKERLQQKFQQDSSDPIFSISKTYPWFQARLVLALSVSANHPFPCCPFPDWILRKIQDLKKRKIPVELMRAIEINYYSGAAWHKAMNGNIDKKLLKEVQIRYAWDSLSAEKAYVLGKFFNHCRALDETIKLLKPFMKPGLYTEDILFLYAWTAIHTREIISEDEWLGWMEEAYRANPKRWKKLVDKDWQLLRWDRLKRLYCNCTVAANEL